VNDDPITFWADFRIAAMLNQRLDLKVDRAGELVSLRNIPTEVGPLGYLDLPGLYPQGEPIAYVTIGDVSPDSAASAAGLQKGDRLVSVDGIPIDDPAVMRDGVQAAAGKSVDLVVKRGSQTLSMALTPEWNGEVERYLIGIFMQGMTYPEPLTQIRYFQGSIFRTLKAFARPKEASRAAQGVGGPVMILSGMHSQVRFHPMQALWFTALINVNLAIINLLPLIILDGGHIMVALFEWITGRRPHRGLIIGLANVMVVVLITLMVFLSLRDVFLLRRLYSEVEPVSTPQVQAPSTEPPPETTDE
jgi:regulator of sigma E protease